MNHYVYLLEHRDKPMWYIGVRSCKCKIADDSYMGSSKSMSKEEKSRCRKIILKRFSTRKEAIEYEIELHSKFEVAISPEFWNKAKQTSTGFDTTGTKYSKERKKQISEKLKGRKGARTWLGKKLPEATRKKMSESTKGVPKSAAHKQALKASHATRVYKAYDNTLHTFTHIDGREVTSTRYDMVKVYNVCKSGICNVLKGTRQSVNGWRLKNG